ncbi:MAG: flagellar export chaperone FliS [Gallionella sp.]|nr:flagellar export chaperone FliS [Gallionella sp.]
MNAAAINSYAKVGVESGVIAADPHKLISMLYQGAVLAIANGKNAMLRKEIPAKGAAISKAIMIIDEGLKASLDKEAGGELAANLAALYDYMGARLVSANLKNDVAMLDEVSKLLCELGSAWDSIRPTTAATNEFASAKAAAAAGESVAKPVAPVVTMQPVANTVQPVAVQSVAPVRPVQSANHNKLAAYGRV